MDTQPRRHYVHAMLSSFWTLLWIATQQTPTSFTCLDFFWHDIIMKRRPLITHCSNTYLTTICQSGAKFKVSKWSFSLFDPPWSAYLRAAMVGKAIIRSNRTPPFNK